MQSTFLDIGDLMLVILKLILHQPVCKKIPFCLAFSIDHL